MRKLTRLWQALENTLGLAAVPAFWQKECGNEFDLLQEYLQPTDEVGANYPCPYSSRSDCPRKIIDHGGGEFVAVCRERPRICADVALKAKEALVHQVDLAALLKPILLAASIRTEALQVRGHGIWSVGLSNRRSSLNQPVFLLVFAGATGFQSAVRDLLLEVTGQFVIMAPTNRHRTVDIQERLQARGIGFLCLEEQVFADERRGFATVEPLESADKVPATPVADRRRVIKEFTTKHRCKVADIQRAAGVHSADYYRWLNGTIPDHYSTCIAIEKVLLAGLPAAPRKTAS